MPCIHIYVCLQNKPDKMSNSITKIDNTIKALVYKISQYKPVNGKLPKQYYSLDKKIKNLRMERNSLLGKKYWNDYLSK